MIQTSCPQTPHKKRKRWKQPGKLLALSPSTPHSSAVVRTILPKLRPDCMRACADSADSRGYTCGLTPGVSTFANMIKLQVQPLAVESPAHPCSNPAHTASLYLLPHTPELYIRRRP